MVVDVAKKKGYEFDAAGWVFWLVVFGLLLGPGIYGSKQIMYEDTPWMQWVGGGVVVAALGAGIISWAVNSVVQRRRKRLRLAEKKRAKKQQR